MIHTNEVPTLPTNWQAAATQFIDGNIAGTPKGTTYFNQYYDQDLGNDRYEYYTVSPVKNEVYRYNDVDAATGCGKVYSFTDTRCCYKALIEDDGTCSSFFTIQLAKRAKDVGAEAKGEHWNETFDQFGISQVQDWWISSDSAIDAYYQTITIGADGTNPQWITANLDYSNQIIGQNTEATYAIPDGCTKTCLGDEFKHFSFKKAASKIDPKAKWLQEHGDLGGCCGCDCHCSNCDGACPPCLKFDFLKQ